MGCRAGSSLAGMLEEEEEEWEERAGLVEPLGWYPPQFGQECGEGEEGGEKWMEEE